MANARILSIPGFIKAIIDRTGERHGHLTILGQYYGPPTPAQRRMTRWFCQCDCGNTVILASSAFSDQGTAKNCGCISTRGGRGSGTPRLHGHNRYNSPTYRSWTNMKDRCFNPNSWVYRYYGAKGVTVCDRWVNSFEDFLSDVGERPEGRTLDRIDPFGDYEPANCRWATQEEQQQNKRARKNAGYGA